MSAPSGSRPEQLLLVWESEVVRTGDGSVSVRAKVPTGTMSAKAAAKMIGCNTWTIRKIWKAGLLKGNKPGAIAKRVDGRGSNAALVLDAASVLAYKQRQDELALIEQGA